MRARIPTPPEALPPRYCIHRSKGLGSGKEFKDPCHKSHQKQASSPVFNHRSIMPDLVALPNPIQPNPNMWFLSISAYKNSLSLRLQVALRDAAAKVLSEAQ